MKKYLLVLFSILLFYVGARGQVVINEFSCSNLSSYLDAFNNYEDWVELYNTGGLAVNLSGYWLSDDYNYPLKYAIPAGVTINPFSKLMVFCSDQDTYIAGQVHTSFKLNQTAGEKIILSTPAGAVVDSSTLFITQLGHSYGRVTDGAATWGFFNVPTPNAANTGAKTGYATKPLFNIQPGNYLTTQSIVISSPDPNVSIHYTIDGTDPTLASTTYSAPISVSATTVIKARAFSTVPSVLPSFIETNTYLINETTTMNVVSVTGPYASLFATGQQIVSSLEYFDKNHVFRFEAEGQMRKHGNDSWAYPQKGIRFHVKDETGYDYALKYPIFTTTPRDTFKVIILKAAASDNYNGNGGPSCHMRDAFAQTLSQEYGLDMDFRRYEPTILYVNGQYWGVYEIRERVDEDYTDYYYGQPAKKIDLLRYWGGMNIDNGSDTGFVNLYNFIMANSMTVAANYAHVTDALDVKSFIQYFVFNEYLVDTDWLDWNTMWWRGRKGNGVKWRYVLWDEDNVMGLGQNFAGVGDVTFENNPCDPISLFQNDPSIMHTDMLSHLLTNPDFKNEYDQTWIDLLNGPFRCENIMNHFDSIIAIIQPEMQRHINRWGGSYAEWQGNVDYMRAQLNGRCAVITGKLDTCLDLKIEHLAYNVSPPGVGTIKMDGAAAFPTYPDSIRARADTTHILKATATAPSYVFDHWKKYVDTNTFSVDTLSNPVTYGFYKADSVVAFFRYYNPDSINVTFKVNPVPWGNIVLDGNTITTYPYTVRLNRNNSYSLKAVATGSHAFVNWTKFEASSTFSPSDTAANITYHFSLDDTVTANFAYVPDPDSINVTFRVNGPTDGTISLDGNVIPSYPYTVTLDRSVTYTLAAQPSQSRGLLDWTSWQSSSTYNPSNIVSPVSYNFRDMDTVTANFVYAMDPDSVLVTFDVKPQGKGTISLENNLITTYPYTVRLDKRNTYSLLATPVPLWQFDNWYKWKANSSFNPDNKSAGVTYSFQEEDSVIANFSEIPIPVDETVVIPTVFSPNGDGLNDVYRIFGKDIKEMDLIIFDRFGEIVFESHDPSNGWDGNFKSQPADIGTYYYSLKIKLENRFGLKDQKFFKGDITLVR